MNTIGKAERATQNRVIALFRDELKYRYLGAWSDRTGNNNIEDGILKDYLAKCNYSSEQINRAIYLLKTEVENPIRSLYENNKAVYSLLRYGVPVKIEAGKVTDTVKLINWGEPAKNDFAVAEEVTLRGNYERRPDLVVYINGIAVAVIELKNSYVSIGEVLLQDRLKKGRERLDEALEALSLLCEPVQPPKGELEHIHYFCGNTEIPDDLKEHEPQRVALYKSTAALVRAFANIADDLPHAGYSDSQIAGIKKDVERYVKLREIIRQASAETIDLKAYEADMRHLIDTYIRADASRTISDFGEIGLLDLIVKSGIAEAINNLPDGIKGNRAAVAETIANNVRSKIIKEHLNDPAFYDKMSALLKEILEDLKGLRIDYETFLKRIADLAKQVQAGKAADTPEKLDTPGKRALYNNLNRDEALALKIDETVRRVRPNAFRGNQAKENVIKAALLPLLGKDRAEVERIFLIIKAQKEY